MIDPQLAEIARYAYAVLAMLTCAGFAATLILRWDVLHLGEKTLRVGLIIVHAVLIYGAWVAISLDYPPTPVGLGLVVGMSVTVTGFALWLGDMLLCNADRSPRRLTDRR
jgi:uncharacterized membrane protein YoaK (UPF0700 family)